MVVLTINLLCVQDSPIPLHCRQEQKTVVSLILTVKLTQPTQSSDDEPEKLTQLVAMHPKG